MIVPAITLWQPWASLIFSGHKLHETRSFRLPVRLIGEVVAIHAAKRPLTVLEEARLDERLWWLARRAIGDNFREEIPYGAVLGFVRFDHCVNTTKEQPTDLNDAIAGDWSPGRWAWPIRERQRLDRPVPATGRQGWWKFETEEVSI